VSALLFAEATVIAALTLTNDGHHLVWELDGATAQGVPIDALQERYVAGDIDEATVERRLDELLGDDGDRTDPSGARSDEEHERPFDREGSGELPRPTALGATRPSLVEVGASWLCVGACTQPRAQWFQTPQAASLYRRFGVSHSYRFDNSQG
jgi:hypothetical protein